ncbi:hypothetical protein PILCRDRAFT_15285 [Piloderma croceum F 1598]|uniref:Uncharacterized protein n=1 Tax=Piloderma croceum (strain F 1598) TaxID=765440 RepID=A0A0C3EZL6_PILCF|nr:hypothetical protein PILCRDRAFT_15285 [Piloderma croceum F 1598]
MPEAFLTYISSQLPFLDAFWRSEWYLTNGNPFVWNFQFSYSKDAGGLLRGF